MELLLHPKDCCNPIASLLLEVIFHALLSSLCYFEYCDDQLKRSLCETSFCESPYKCNCVLKSGNKFSFSSCLLKHFTERPKKLKMQSSKPSGWLLSYNLLWLGSQTAWPTIIWLKLMSSMKTIQANKNKTHKIC